MVVALASNQVEELRTAQRKLDNAKDAGVTGRDLQALEAARDAAQARVDSATGSTNGGSWGDLS